MKTLAQITIAFLLTASLSAQTVKRDTMNVHSKDTVTVTGRASHSAASDVKIRASNFALRPRNSAQDILRLVPGLVIAQHAGGGKAEQIFLRGFDCDHGTDVNISVDGAPVNMVSHGHGQGYADLHFIIPETVRSVDVAKGPYFANYGDLATAGAVVFHTADTLDKSLIKLEGGSFGTYRAVGLLNATLLPSTKGYIGAEVFGSDGYFDRSQHFHRLNLIGKTRTLFDNRTSLILSIMGFNSQWDASGQIPVRAVENGTISRFGSLDSNEGGNTSRTTVSAIYQSNGNDPYSLSLSYTDYRFRLFSDFTFFLHDSLRGDMIEQTDTRSILGVKGSKSFFYTVADIGLQTVVGGDVRRDNIHAALFHDSARTRLEAVHDNNIREDNVGVFVEQNIALPWAQIQLGVRTDYFGFDVENLTADNRQPEGFVQQVVASPKANVSIPIDENTVVFANSGFGFHSNDARAVVGQSKDRALPRAFGSEIGARYTDNTFAVSAAAWLLDLDNEFVYIGDEGTTEESGKTRRTGIDMEIQIKPFDWLSFSADATLSRGRFTELAECENRIPLAPNFTLTANAVARWTDFSAALRLRHIGDRPANETNTVTAKGYTVLDFSASFTLMPNIELFLNAENILNVEWNEAQFDTESRLKNEVAGVSELHFTPGTPVSVRGGVGVRF